MYTPPKLSIKILIIIGLISSILSFLSHYFFKNPEYEMNLEFLPGIIFSLFIGMYYIVKTTPSKPILRLLLFTIIGEIGFLIAEFTTISPFMVWIYFFSAAIGGIFGTLILLTGFSLVFQKRFTPIDFITTTLIGGVLGMSSWIIPLSGISFSSSESLTIAPEFYLSLYLFWQTGMAITLGLVLNSKNKTNKKH